MSDYFYGWYFRCQGKEGSIAVIPAVHISAKRESCSIQIITESGSWNKVFPIRQFRINRGKGIMQIGENLFSRKGIRLNLETEGMQICGILRFGEFAEPEYDIMGPFRYIPRMECRHSIQHETFRGRRNESKWRAAALPEWKRIYGRGQRELLPGEICMDTALSR